MQNIELQTIPNANRLSGHELLEGFESHAIINTLEERGVAVEDRMGVAHSLDLLRDEFGINDEAFRKPVGRLMMVAIANRLNSLEKSSDVTVTEKTAELEYIADLVMDTVGEHTAYGSVLESSLEDGVTDERKKAVYEKYTQPEVTKDLDDFIRGEAFDDLRKRLGVSEEEPYEVKVLSIDKEDGGLSFGLDPGVDWDGVEGVDAVNAALADQDQRREYKAGLVANGKAFNEEIGSKDEMPPAWVTWFDDGTKYLCMPLPTAEKVLYGDEKRANYYTADTKSQDLAILMHEYTHTQKMLMTGKSIGAGIALEELRAEHFSGDKHGYTDIKKFFMGVRMLTGYSPKQSFESDANGYDEELFITDIAKNIGLEGYVESMTAIPQNYANAKGANTYVRAIVAHNGGNLSGSFQKMYDRLAKERGVDELNSHVSEFVDTLRESVNRSVISVESWFAYGGLESFAKIGIENFRRRYPDESDGYDYFKPSA